MTLPTLTIVSDGKPGHLNQSRGLANAIGRRVDVQVVEVPVQSIYKSREFNSLTDQNPDTGLIIAAGRSASKLAVGLYEKLRLPIVLLMNPGWYCRRQAHLCIIPEHDGFKASSKVILTQGALNTITPATQSSPDEALLLVGGPSKHHNWEDETLLVQLHTLLARDKHLRWTATGSRRTPEHTDKVLRELAEEHGERFTYTPASETPQGWVAEQLQRCGIAWVTEDSVSMVYESLTAGARVGLIDVPRKGSKPGRVVRGVISLIERGWVTTFDDWYEHKPLPEDRPPLAEADRVAGLVLERFDLS